MTTASAHPAIPQLDFSEQIARWVAPGGTLLFVGHLGGRARRREGAGFADRF